MATLKVAFNGFSLLVLVAFSCFFQQCFCFNPKKFDVDDFELTALGQTTNWSDAGATWYGDPNGFGSDGGACGYGDAVGKAPFSCMITATGPSLYKNGEGCGACFKVKCSKRKYPGICSGKPVKVVVTDSCPGGVCATGPAHFDLSGTAFGAMAVKGAESSLRDKGVLDVRYARSICDYGSQGIEFRVDQGANPYYMALIIQYQAGEGDLSKVELQESGSTEWRAMDTSWGAVWKLNAGAQLHCPMSVRLTSASGKTLVAKDVIPDGWCAGSTYKAAVNF